MKSWWNWARVTVRVETSVGGTRGSKRESMLYRTREEPGYGVYGGGGGVYGRRMT